MPHSVRYKRAAAAEIEAAICWYRRPEIDQAPSFIKELERTEAHLRTLPALYQQVEDEIHRAVLRRFPGTGKLRFLEVKGRLSGASTITVTRNEILYSLNKPEDFILAIVEYVGDTEHRVHYVRRPFQREPDVARRRMDTDVPPARAQEGSSQTPPREDTGGGGKGATQPKPAALPRRFHGSVTLDTMRVGRDAGRIAEEVIAHLSGLVGAEVTVALEIHAEVPSEHPTTSFAQ